MLQRFQNYDADSTTAFWRVSMFLLLLFSGRLVLQWLNNCIPSCPEFCSIVAFSNFIQGFIALNHPYPSIPANTSSPPPRTQAASRKLSLHHFDSRSYGIPSHSTSRQHTTARSRSQHLVKQHSPRQQWNLNLPKRRENNWGEYRSSTYENRRLLHTNKPNNNNNPNQVAIQVEPPSINRYTRVSSHLSTISTIDTEVDRL